MRLGRLPPLNNNNITASPTCQEPLPFSTRGCSQPFQQDPGWRRNTWGTKVGHEAPELQTGSVWGDIQDITTCIPPCASTTGRCEMQNTSWKGLFPIPVQSTYPARTGGAAQPSISSSLHLVLLLDQLFGEKDECRFWELGSHCILPYYQGSLLDFPYYFLVMLLHSFHKNPYDFPKVLLFLSSSRGCRWQLLAKECGWQPGIWLNSGLYLLLQEKPGGISTPATEKTIINLIFCGCSNNWPQSIDVWPSGVSPATDSPAISPRGFSPGYDFAHVVPKIFWKAALCWL